jgi:hypothetical protein
VTNENKKENFWSRKSLISLGIIVNFLGIPTAAISYRIISPLIEESVFNGLLVAISIFIGFISVIVTFYLGKMDEHETQFLHALNNARVFEKEFITSMNQFYSHISSRKNKTEKQDNALKKLRDWIEHWHSNPLYTKEDRDNILKEAQDFRMLTIRWGVISLAMYVVGLLYSVAALLLIDPNSENLSQEPLLSFAIASLFFSTLWIIIWNIFVIILFWSLGQHMMYTYRKTGVNVQDFADSELGKVLIEVTKSVVDETDKEGNNDKNN